MRNTLILFLILLFSCVQKPIKQSEEKPKEVIQTKKKNKTRVNKSYIDDNNKKQLIGIVTKNHLKTDAIYKEWFQENYNSYVLQDTTIKELKSVANNFQYKIFMGTWCSDSRQGVPEVYKLFDALKIDSKSIELIALNNDKKSNLGEEKGLNITNVPTLIVFENKKEINRIVETPIKSWEVDLFKILKKENYTPNYTD